MLKNFTLLYAEDDKETVEAMKILLSDEVKKLYVAYNGVEALKIYKAEKPDIVLTDINMPKMNGIELAKKIRKIDKNVPIAILTAFNEKHLLHESVEIGVDCYVTKPLLDLDKLLNPLHKIAARLQGEIDSLKLQKLLQMQSKMAALGEMIGNIAHQWRQPLSIITTHTSHLSFMVDMKEEITSEMLRSCTKGVEDQAKYLSSTIDDFRSFFKADISKIEKVNIKIAVQKTLNLVKSSLNNNFIETIVSLEDLYVRINENQLIQALINICNNAKDAMSEIKEDRYFFISLTHDKDNAFITLIDSGGGVNEEIIDRVFEPYFTTKHPSVGTGIGLYMSYSIIVNQFNGKIEVTNTEYNYDGKDLRGASFLITLPLA